nr:carboxypeptidase-like regulatory domain-containing protein [Saprospiraceae bacterium]
MKVNYLFKSTLVVLFAFSLVTAWGQGSTSSRITGLVTDDGEPLIGATVLAVHQPTGFQYGSATNLEGLFTLNNVNVGGPYKITISYTGYETQEIENIFLALGQTESFNIELSQSSVSLEEIIVTAGGLFDGNRTGSETKVSAEAIATLPTADRGLNDFLRLTPQADVANNGSNNSGGISFTGVNNRFN